MLQVLASMDMPLNDGFDVCGNTMVGCRTACDHWELAVCEINERRASVERTRRVGCADGLRCEIVRFLPGSPGVVLVLALHELKKASVHCIDVVQDLYLGKVYTFASRAGNEAAMAVGLHGCSAAVVGSNAVHCLVRPAHTLDSWTVVREVRFEGHVCWHWWCRLCFEEDGDTLYVDCEEPVRRARVSMSTGFSFVPLSTKRPAAVWGTQILSCSRDRGIDLWQGEERVMRVPHLRCHNAFRVASADRVVQRIFDVQSATTTLLVLGPALSLSRETWMCSVFRATFCKSLRK